jgi:hypothetical protein
MRCIPPGTARASMPVAVVHCQVGVAARSRPLVTKVEHLATRGKGLRALAPGYRHLFASPSHGPTIAPSVPHIVGAKKKSPHFGLECSHISTWTRPR